MNPYKGEKTYLLFFYGKTFTKFSKKIKIYFCKSLNFINVKIKILIYIIYI